MTLEREREELSHAGRCSACRIGGFVGRKSFLQATSFFEIVVNGCWEIQIKECTWVGWRVCCLNCLCCFEKKRFDERF